MTSGLGVMVHIGMMERSSNFQRVLITGGTGRLARNWAATLLHDYDIVLADSAGIHSCLEVEHAAIDLGDKYSLARQLLDISPEVVVHTAGLTNVESCQDSPALAHEANVKAATNVAEVCSFLDIALVHISTDHLFDLTPAG